MGRIWKGPEALARDGAEGKFVNRDKAHLTPDPKLRHQTFSTSRRWRGVGRVLRVVGARR
jgi:hypothetical protein